MSFRISDKTMTDKLTRNLEQARKEKLNSLEKLSSGQIFTSVEPKPAERALAEGLEQRVRSLNASKRNVNDALSLLQTAESAMTEINHIINRMKEINVSAASTTMGDQDRRYLFIEYEALFDELNRIAVTTEFNGIPLLNGQSDKAPEKLIFRLDDPIVGEDGFSDDEDINTITFEGVSSVVATAEALGLRSSKDLLSDTTQEEGLELEDVLELMEPEDDEYYASVYEEAIGALATQRSIYGSMQSRLYRALDYIDVYQENISAAKSKIADTDYAREVSKMTQNNILLHATTGLLAQTNSGSSMTLNLISSILR